MDTSALPLTLMRFRRQSLGIGVRKAARLIQIAPVTLQELELLRQRPSSSVAHRLEIVYGDTIANLLSIVNVSDYYEDPELSVVNVQDRLRSSK